MDTIHSNRPSRSSKPTDQCRKIDLRRRSLRHLNEKEGNQSPTQFNQYSYTVRCGTLGPHSGPRVDTDPIDTPSHPNPLLSSTTHTMLPPSISRQLLRGAVRAAARPSPSAAVRAASNTTHAISKPTLANIEKRWEGLPLQEKADLWMALRDRMKESWKDLTLQEQRAAYWIAFGPHGPRSEPPPGENARVALYTAIGIGVSFVIFIALRQFARPPPHTMNREWQEATNEKMLEQKADPITGISSEGYVGKGFVQSPPADKH
ncbi:hypothetical protein P8C59_005920 [Phyllachora maydis]|uniref:Cytochrome c oxidase polypeptide V n=1 Tax=Phyllachora maydis TaxID=1825666 RepID=A0AAD9I5N1_9PEZI|nr:hypothetical protein P8C59_005920 [Phyllachora maydis]